MLASFLQIVQAGTASIYAEPSDGTTINFGNNVVATAQASVTIFHTDGGGDAKAQSDLIKDSLEVTGIICNFNGQDASNFSVLTPMPAGPISIGGNLDIDLLVNVNGNNSLLTASLLCNYQYGATNGAFTWPVQVTGVAATQAQVVPSLNTVGIIVMILILLTGLLLSKNNRKFY